jgi:hypothetical protein
MFVQKGKIQTWTRKEEIFVQDIQYKVGKNSEATSSVASEKEE